MIRNPRLSNGQTRRRLIREFLASMEEAKGALKTAWRQEPPHRVANRLATSMKDLSEVWGGSLVDFGGFQKALSGGKWKAASKALAACGAVWCDWAEEQGAWGDIPGWADQRARVIATCSMDVWLAKVTKKGRKAPKAPAKAEAPKAEVEAPSELAGALLLLAKNQTAMIDGLGDVGSKLDKLVDALV